jgi:hypothetical protein
MIKPIDPPSRPPGDPALPTTVEGAAEKLLDQLSDWDDLPLLAEMDDVALECLHVTLGPYIRNKLGLWQGNEALLEDCGTSHPDDAYVVILDALVQRLRSTGQR